VPPLANRRILITRAPHQASELAAGLRALGAEPILIPTIQIAPPASYAALDAALAQLPTFDLIAFTSANAVEAFHQRAQNLNIPLAPSPSRIAAVGPSTARALTSIGLHADILPPTYTAESLAATLAPNARGQRILLIRPEAPNQNPDAPPDPLVATLTTAGAHLTIAPAYANRIPAESLAAIAQLFAHPTRYPDAVTFTSASTARNLVALLEAATLTLPPAILRASIGPITSRTLHSLNLPPHIEAAEPTIPALIAALTAHFTGTTPHQ
jgi:uroporphyrinogen-III synthase